jgi:creatinine amidohydrolase
MAKTIAQRTNAMIAPTFAVWYDGSMEAYPGAFQISEAAYRPFVKQILEAWRKTDFATSSS